jgi:hypothetical protein
LAIIISTHYHEEVLELIFYLSLSHLSPFLLHFLFLFLFLFLFPPVLIPGTRLTQAEIQ